MLYQKGIDEELGLQAGARHSITAGACCTTLAVDLLGLCKIDSLPNTIIDVARNELW